MMSTRHVRVALVALALTAGWAAPAAAQAGRAQVEEGNRLYAEGQFGEAHAKYLEALTENPESPIIRFNAGNALYRNQDLQRAAEAYQQAVESGDPALASAAWYNLGNALYRAQQLESSLEAYKQALRIDPSDVDAKHNLERVLEQLQEQQQQKEQGGGQSQDDQEDGEQDSQQDPGENQQEGGPDPRQGEPPPAGEQPPQPEPGEQEPQEGEGQPQPREGEMTPEEAQRLLDALDEDPGDVNRKPAAARGRKPRKIW